MSIEIISIVSISISGFLTAINIGFAIFVFIENNRRTKKKELSKNLRDLIYISIPDSLYAIINSNYKFKEEKVLEFMQLKYEVETFVGVLYFSKPKKYEAFIDKIKDLEDACIKLADGNANMIDEIKKLYIKCKKIIEKVYC